MPILSSPVIVFNILNSWIRKFGALQAPSCHNQCDYNHNKKYARHKIHQSIVCLFNIAEIVFGQFQISLILFPANTFQLLWIAMNFSLLNSKIHCHPHIYCYTEHQWRRLNCVFANLWSFLLFFKFIFFEGSYTNFDIFLFYTNMSQVYSIFLINVNESINIFQCLSFKFNLNSLLSFCANF